MKREHLDLDDDCEVKDGETVRTRLYLTDAVRFEDGEPRFVRASDGVDLSGHRPGYAQLTDEQIAMRRAARDAAIERATQAWRGDARRRKKPNDDDERYKTEVEGATGQNETDIDEMEQSALHERLPRLETSKARR